MPIGLFFRRPLEQFGNQVRRPVTPARLFLFGVKFGNSEREPPFPRDKRRQRQTSANVLAREMRITQKLLFAFASSEKLVNQLNRNPSAKVSHRAFLMHSRVDARPEPIVGPWLHQPFPWPAPARLAAARAVLPAFPSTGSAPKSSHPAFPPPSRVPGPCRPSSSACWPPFIPLPRFIRTSGHPRPARPPGIRQRGCHPRRRFQTAIHSRYKARSHIQRPRDGGIEAPVRWQHARSTVGGHLRSCRISPSLSRPHYVVVAAFVLATIESYVAGGVLTACCMSRKNSFPRLFDFRRLKRKVNSSR